MRTLLLSAVAAIGLAACSDPCLTLAEKICDCEATPSLVEVCRDNAQAEQARQDVSGEDSDRCDAQLDSCTCEALATPEGKQACGLARAPNQ